MSEIDIGRAQTISDNLNKIMELADLTIDGMAEFVGISKSTVNRALLMTSNLSRASISKIATPFDLKPRELTDKTLVRVLHIPKIKKLIQFKEENIENFKFVASEAKKHNAQLFVKNQLLEDEYFRKERKMGEITSHLKKSLDFQKEFTKDALEQSIKRILKNENFLVVTNTTEHGKVFYYKVIPILKDDN
jgi:transcriptional regulator with XRE-family HTH domain